MNIITKKTTHKDNNFQVKNIANDTDDLKLSLRAYQNDKKNIEISFEKAKEKYKHEIERLHKKNYEAKNKLREL